MQLIVQFADPIIVDAEKLPVLLALVGGPAHVTPVVELAQPVVKQRKPRASAPTDSYRHADKPTLLPPVDEALAPLAPEPAEPQAASPELPKRPRGPRKHIPAAPPATAPIDSLPADPGAAALAAGSPSQLLARFTGMVEANFDNALNLLDTFGAERFSGIKAEQYPAFDTALTEAGY